MQPQLFPAVPARTGLAGFFALEEVAVGLLERVCVFVDYQNVFMMARRCFHKGPYGPTAGQIDPLELGQLIVSRRRRPSVVHQVRVYRGLPDATRQPRLYAANERQAAAWVQSPLVEVIRRPLRYPGRWPEQPAEEKVESEGRQPSAHRGRTASLVPRAARSRLSEDSGLPRLQPILTAIRLTIGRG